MTTPIPERFSQMRPTQVVAHRGFSAAFPENTLTAFREAARLGVDVVEFDVRLTADRRLVIMHDPTIDRTTDGRGAVEDLTLDQIRRFDAAAGSGRAPEPAPTLEETLETLADVRWLNVQLYALDDTRDELVELALEELRGLGHRAYLASDEATLQVAKRLDPAIPRCNLDVYPVDDYLERSRRLECAFLQPRDHDVTREMVEEAHRVDGATVNVFYANDRQRMLEMIDLGIDAILTDHPDVLLALLDGRR